MDLDTTLAALKALSQEHRLRAFRALAAAGDAGLAVGELRVLVDLPPATLTAHLNVLRGGGAGGRSPRGARDPRPCRLRADERTAGVPH